MIFGFTPAVFIHVLISLVGIATGFVVLFAWLGGRHQPGWTAAFLLTTLATSLSGFPLPAERFLPSHAVGILSVLVLAVSFYALYARGLEGGWRRAFVISGALAQYFNVFVLVVQLFGKVPALKQLAPNQNEPPFAVAQLAVLAAFVLLTWLADRRFRPGATGFRH